MKNEIKFAEIWMNKFLEFLKEFPEDIREKWMKSLNPLILTNTIDGIHYGVLFNCGRKDRLEIKNNKSLNIPDFYESIKRYNAGKNNTVLFGTDYLPYYALVNIFPLMPSHTTLAYETPNPYTGIDKRVGQQDLETMIKFSEDTGSVVWHNMSGVGSTIPTWEHWQASSFIPPIRYAKKVACNSKDHIYHMPDYPGTNIIFNGETKTENALKMKEILELNKIPHSIVVDGGYIYIIPVKDDMAGSKFGLDEKSRIGSFELTGYYVALNIEDFYRFASDELMNLPGLESLPKDQKVIVKTVLEKGLFSEKELDLLNFL